MQRQYLAFVVPLVAIVAACDRTGQSSQTPAAPTVQSTAQQVPAEPAPYSAPPAAPAGSAAAPPVIINNQASSSNTGEILAAGAVGYMVGSAIAGRRSADAGGRVVERHDTVREVPVAVPPPPAGIVVAPVARPPAPAIQGEEQKRPGYGVPARAPEPRATYGAGFTPARPAPPPPRPAAPPVSSRPGSYSGRR